MLEGLGSLQDVLDIASVLFEAVTWLLSKLIRQESVPPRG